MAVTPKDPRTKANQEVNNLLKQAQDFKNKLSAKNNDKTDSANVIDSIKGISSDIGYIAKTIYHIKEAFAGFYQRYIKPVLSFLNPIFGWIFKYYLVIWNRYAYSTDKTICEKVFSRKKSSFIILITVLFVSAFTPTSLGNAVRFITVEPIVDGILILASKKSETFYLYNSEEIDPEANVHSVRGCRVIGECSEKDSIYFRVKPRLAHDIWKLTLYGNPIYVPDHVVAPIAPGVNKCLVTYYGYRMTSSWISRLLRSFQVYPIMLEASCEHETSTLLK
jgi:hypothetical protein